MVSVPPEAPTPRRPPLPRRLLGCSVSAAAVLAVAMGVSAVDRVYGFRDGAEDRVFAASALVAAVALWALAAWLLRRPPTRAGGLVLLLGLALAGGACSWMAIRAGSPWHVREKRTMADIRTLATAVESYAMDEKHYPRAATAEELVRELTPKYGTQLQATDFWGFPLRYELAGSGDAERFFLGSAGKYGRWERPRLADYTPGDNDSEGDDIVWGGDGFVRAVPVR